ncbi:hypothetical protein M7I_5081 [Glarea lozoyensis 74030]|uniref:Uncharacterized protein n=1 Tax=Glarea lozoyensis (strain ATCC 74030 / MF5533) TaxID=1104152 RepID=H0EQX2_GLAL7|nr:hypothetical protein M7I_5081 [Glarea lozoyensis 74030]
MKEDEVVKIIKDGKAALLAHREKERVRPGLDDKVIVSWNGIAIGALARTAAVIKGFDPEKSEEYIASALKAATFIKEKLYDEEARILYRIWREETQLTHFYDTTGTGGFFSTSASAPHLILRLKDGMDSSEPSTNGTSASNLFRLSSLLNDDSYASKAKETIRSFESEMLQYPWLFSSFMPALVAGQLGVKGVVVGGAGEVGAERIRSFERMPRGGVMTFARVSGEGGWLRERNELLRSFGTDGRGRVLVCEEGVCREEGVVEVETEGGKAGDVSGVVPSVEEGGVSVKEEDSVVAGILKLI